MKLDENTYNKIINSNEFIKWFGNWKKPDRNTSKIVDKDGKPLVVYHGSPYKFTEFKYGVNDTSGQMGAEYAFWFSNINVAKHYSLCYPRSFYKEKDVVRKKYNEMVEKDKIVFLKSMDMSVWKSLSDFMDREWGKSTGYYNFLNYVKTENWEEISKTLESIMYFLGKKNIDEINPELSKFIHLEDKYKESMEKELEVIQKHYDSQEGYIYPCFIKATIIEEENGENVGVGLNRIPDRSVHCKIIRNADTGAAIADEYVVTDPKRIKIATGENTTFNPKSKNIYEMITRFEVFEKKQVEMCNNVLCFNKKLKKMGFISKDDLFKVRVIIRGDGDVLDRTFDIEVPDINIKRKYFETTKEYKNELEYWENEVSVEGWNLYGEETEWREIFFHQIEDVVEDLNL